MVSFGIIIKVPRLIVVDVFDGRDDMDGAEMRNRWNLLDDMIAEQASGCRNGRARMTSVDGDRPRRIDVHACIVVLVKGHRNCVITHARRVRQHLKLVHVEVVLATILAVDNQVRLHARVVERRDHLEPAVKVSIHAPAADTHRHTSTPSNTITFEQIKSLKA